jgi:epoxyqueuosine reductase QueG
VEVMNLTLDNILDFITRRIDEPGGNYIGEEIAISPELAGMRIFDSPLIGVASSDDAIFEEYRNEGVIGRHFITPRGWLPDALSVVSIFFPFTQNVCASNAAVSKWPSGEWLHGRIEGQAFIDKTLRELRDEITGAGYPSLAPVLESRFVSVTKPGKKILPGRSFTSVWSERHAAYACGLGTFGLSKGLITKKGVAGRFGSVVTALKLTPTLREYNGAYEYCTMCGACARKCPAHAITVEGGKSHPICSEFVNETNEKFAPRYGCGKCQAGVPCQGQPPRH